MDISTLITTLNAVGEKTKIEAKTGREIGKSILETICAFSNEPHLDGGILLIGLKKIETPKKIKYQIVGVPNPEKLMDDLVSQCRTTFNIPVYIEVHHEVIKGKTILGISVPEMNNSQKPVYFKSQGLPQGAFRRIGSSDVRCTEDDLVLLYQHREFETFDYTAMVDAEFNDIDPEAVQDYRNSRSVAHANAEELRWSDQELLQALGCLRKVKNQLLPTVAGILLFGTHQALRRLFPLARIDYIRVPGKQWMIDPQNRFTGVEIRAPLLTAIRKTLAAIMDDLPKAFSLPEGSAQRQDIPIIPVEVIREAVVNAVMHRNYRVNQPIQIIRYANRIEIRNAGYSLIPEDQLGEPGSKSRNTKIAGVLHETHFAETKGSGIRIMRESMRKVGLSPPFFESDRSRDLFTATFLFHHFLGEEDLEWLAHFRHLHLSDEQARALIFIKEVGAINNSAYRSMTQADTLTASTSLRNLRDAGLLEAKGQGSGTYYIPTEKLLNPGSKRHQVSPKGHQLEGKGHQLTVKGHQLDLPQTIESSIPPLPQHLQAQLNSLGKKASTSQLRRVIMALCEWQELTPTTLAELLKRDKKRLVRMHLSPMVKEGLLVYKYPQMLMHPQQAYRTQKGSQ